MGKNTLFARLLLGLVLIAATACGAAPGPLTNTTPSHADSSGLAESSPSITTDEATAPDNADQSAFSDGSGTVIQRSEDGPVRLNPPTLGNGPLLIHAPSTWKPRLTISKCLADLAPTEICTNPYEIVETEGNNVTTAGANSLWSGLTGTLGTAFSTTNAQFGVGDSSTAFGAGQTDLQAALGTKLNAADCTGATNATPIVVTCTFSPTPVVGQVVAISGFTGAGASAINNTFELSAASSSAITLLNSAGTGSITLASGIIQPVNKYRQQANGAGSAVVSTNQVVYVATVAAAVGNFAWNEWSITTGAAATNKQAAPPPSLLNRAVVNLGTKTSSSSWTATLTLTLS